MEQYFIDCENKTQTEIMDILEKLNPYYANWKRKRVNKELIDLLMGKQIGRSAAYNNQGGSGANKFYLMWIDLYKQKLGIAIKIVYYKYGWPPLKLNEKYNIKVY